MAGTRWEEYRYILRYIRASSTLTYTGGVAKDKMGYSDHRSYRPSQGGLREGEGQGSKSIIMTSSDICGLRMETMPKKWVSRRQSVAWNPGSWHFQFPGIAPFMVAILTLVIAAVAVTIQVVVTP